MHSLKPQQKLQRARGRAHLGFVAHNSSTKLKDLHQSGCVKALLPRNHASRIDAVLINTAGGVTGGDRLSYSAKVEDEAAVCLTTQTAERIYKSSSGAGSITTDFELGRGASLDWLPQETILFNACALKRKITVNMAADSSVLLLEPIVLGRKAMNETLEKCEFTDHWRVKRAGKMIYADSLRLINPPGIGGNATLGSNRAFATLVYIAPDAESRLEYMRNLLSFEAVDMAASAWNGCLVTRFIAADAQPLRNALIAILSQFRAHPLPRVWHM